MYRKSSKGNPYHDARGRFASADGKSGVNHGEAVMWASRGMVEDISEEGLSKAGVKSVSEFNHKIETKAPTKSRDYYFGQSQVREANAVRISQMNTNPEDFPPKKTIWMDSEGNILPKRRRGATAVQKPYSRQQIVKYKTAIYKAENYYAKNRDGGGKTVLNFGGRNNIQGQSVQAPRITNKTMQKGNSSYVDTKTSMSVFHGYTVESYTGNEYVRSCPKNASKADVQKHIDDFCQKYRSILSQPNTCLKIWSDADGRVRYMPVKKFATNKEAQEFAKTQPNATITSHDPNWKRSKDQKKAEKDLGSRTRKAKHAEGTTKEDNAFSSKNNPSKALDRSKEKSKKKK
jgi:hypothetical protein